MRQVFRTDLSIVICWFSLQEAVLAAASTMSPRDMWLSTDEIDTNSDGTVSLAEFAAAGGNAQDFAMADRDNNGELSFEASEINKNSVLCAAAQPTDNSCVVCAPQEFHGPAEEVFKTHFPDQPLDQEDVKKWFNATQEDSSQKLTKVLWRSCRLTKWQLADDGHCCAGTVPRLHEFRLLEQAVR